MGLQAVFLCPKQRPWVFSVLVIFDNRLRRHSQSANELLREKTRFRILLMYLGPFRALSERISGEELQNACATQRVSPDATRGPACTHTDPPSPECPQSSAPKKNLPHNSLANHDSCIARGLSSAKFDVSRSKIAKWPNEV